ncbi:MAG TPA: MaoC/PaaZ C-terminal domain-containing protein [Actinomycetales bacterium]|nr:MaoC/PaaZ C-terminal domain-containing protein [Actinomycetales bacterium]
MASFQSPSTVDYVRAALPALPGAALVPGLRRSGRGLPEEVVRVEDVQIDATHLAAYDEVCGFALSDSLPGTYPHVLSFAAQMKLLTSRNFPFPAVGMVHVANRITVHRPLDIHDRLTFTVSVANLRPHPRGQQLDLVTNVTVDRETVWEGVSTYLRRGPGGDPSAERPGPEPIEITPGPGQWRLPADLGRRYAAVSGDCNPIHINSLLARAFGFPRAIAHGMWTAARALADIQPRLPRGYRYDVAFGTPILLPSTVSFAARAGEAPGRAELAVVDRSGRSHLTGIVDEL